MTDRFHDQVQEAIAPAYTVDRELKGGGMSRVFVAVEQALGRTVVVNVLRPDLAADVNRERFRREIMLVAKLQHPHIVPVLSAGERGDLLWYTMPFDSLRMRAQVRDMSEDRTLDVIEFVVPIREPMRAITEPYGAPNGRPRPRQLGAERTTG